MIYISERMPNLFDNTLSLIYGGLNSKIQLTNSPGFLIAHSANGYCIMYIFITRKLLFNVIRKKWNLTWIDMIMYESGRRGEVKVKGDLLVDRNYRNDLKSTASV